MIRAAITLKMFFNLLLLFVFCIGLAQGQGYNDYNGYNGYNGYSNNNDQENGYITPWLFAFVTASIACLLVMHARSVRPFK